MNLVLAFSQKDAVAWLCFVIGTTVLFGGVAAGLWTSFKHAPRKAEEAKAKLEDAREKIDEAKAHIEDSRSAAAGGNLESFNESTADASTATEAAGASTDAAKSALEQVQGIVAALPENLRFAGLLILVGTVLMGVATIQFGGVSLF